MPCSGLVRGDLYLIERVNAAYFEQRCEDKSDLYNCSSLPFTTALLHAPMVQLSTTSSWLPKALARKLMSL